MLPSLHMRFHVSTLYLNRRSIVLQQLLYVNQNTIALGFYYTILHFKIKHTYPIDKNLHSLEIEAT